MVKKKIQKVKTINKAIRGKSARKKNTKKFRLTITTTLLVAALLTGAIFTVKAIYDQVTSQNQIAPTKITADALKVQAIKALRDKNFNGAKTLFQQAQQQYKTLEDTNNIVDTDAQIYLIDHLATSAR